MASRRALAAAAAGGTTALALRGSHADDVAECDASASPLSASFDVITQAEIDEVTRELAKGVPSPSGVGGSGGGGSMSASLTELGNGWLSSDEETTQTVMALGRDLATDPRVQQAVMDRIADPRRLAQASSFVDDLKLVLVSRQVVPDGERSSDEGGQTTVTVPTPGLSRDASMQTVSDASTAELPAGERDDDGAAAQVHWDSAQTAPAPPAYAHAIFGRPETKDAAASEDAAREPAAGEEEEPSLAAELIKTALIVAGVIVLTVVARRLNAKAASIAAAALASAWQAMVAPFRAPGRG